MKDSIFVDLISLMGVASLIIGIGVRFSFIIAGVFGIFLSTFIAWRLNR